MHVTFFSEAAPLRKTIGHQLSWMPAYREPACGNKADSLNAPEPLQQHCQGGRCWHLAGAALSPPFHQHIIEPLLD